MRNLKRALSLALASVMVLGLMVVGSGASYADVTSEDNVEAIEVLQAVGVMVGDDEGNFNPDKNVTRNEMAVVMSNLLDLKVEDFNAADIPFTDVPSWAVSYVAACYADGITSGTSATTYGGSNTVTAAQAALMMMKALGYFQNQGDFEQDWTLATIKKGSEIGIFDGITIDRTSPLTRNDVAQMALNALKSNMVTFTGDVGIEIPSANDPIVVGYNPEYTYKTSSERQYDRIDDVASTIGNPYGQYYVQLGEELYDSDLELSGDIDVFGRPANYWEYDGKEVGTYVNYGQLEQEYTTEVTSKDLYDLLGKSTLQDYDLYVYIDGEDDGNINDDIFAASDISKNDKTGIGGTGNGTLTQVFVDTESKDIIITIINTYLARADKDYDEKKDELDVTVYGLNKVGDEYVKVNESCTNDKDDSEGFTLDGEDFDVADLVEDDALLVTVADGEVQTAIQPEIISDVEITAFKLNSSVTADGTKYNYSDAAEYDFEVLDHYTGASGSNLKDLTYNVYLDKYGYAIGVDLVETPNNYVFVTGVDSSYSNLSNKTLDASAIFIDGTMEVIEVKSDKGNFAGTYTDAALVNQWYTYTVDKNGVYTLTLVSDKINTDDGVKVAQYADANHDTLIDLKHTSLPGSKGGNYNKVYGNDATVYLTASIKEIMTEGNTSKIIIDAVDSVTTGVKNANIQPWDKAYAKGEAEDDIKGQTSADNASGVYTLYKSNGYIIAAVVVGDDGAAAKNLVYVSSSSVEQESYDKTTDEWTWTRMVVVDGEEVEIREVSDGISMLSNMKQDFWYQVKYNAEGEVIEVLDARDAAMDDTMLDLLESNPYTDGTFNDWDLIGNKYVIDIDAVDVAVNNEDTVLYLQGFEADHPVLRGSTLFVTTTDTEGFFVTEDVSVVLRQYNKNKMTTTIETGVDELENILDDLNTKNGKDYSYIIGAILEDGGATTVVIYDATNTYERPEDPTNPSDSPAGGKFDADRLEFTSLTVVDDDEQEAVINALRAAGYGKFTNWDLTNHKVTAEDKDGDSITLDYSTALTNAQKYWSVTIDGKVTEYVEDGEDTTTIKGQTGDGEGFISRYYDNSGNKWNAWNYYAYGSPEYSGVSYKIEVKTGYVDVTATTVTNDSIYTDWNGSFVAAPDYLTAGDTFQVNVQYTSDASWTQDDVDKYTWTVTAGDAELECVAAYNATATTSASKTTVTITVTVESVESDISAMTFDIVEK